MVHSLVLRGYRRVSNSGRVIARIDRPDWVQHMAQELRRAPADFYIPGESEVAPNWCDHYRRCFSKDKIVVDEIVFKQIPSSSYDSIGYVPKTCSFPRMGQSESRISRRYEAPVIRIVSLDESHLYKDLKSRIWGLPSEQVNDLATFLGESAVKKKDKSRKTGLTLQQALSKKLTIFAGHVEVVGGYYHKMWEAKVDGKLDEGTWLRMVRESSNFHDKNAIAVYTKEGQMVGYVKKEEAEKLSAFMDAGMKMALRVLVHIHQPMRMTCRLYLQKVGR